MGGPPILVEPHGLAQGAQRRRGAALYSTQGHSGAVGDLALREAVEVSEDEHLLMNRREPRERGGHVEDLRELARRVCLSWLEERFAVDGPDTRLAASDQVRRPVAGDAVHPRGEARPRGVEGRRVLPHRGEDVLDQLLSCPPVSQVTHPRPVDQPSITVVESGEGALVPGCYPSHQNLIFHTL